MSRFPEAKTALLALAAIAAIGVLGVAAFDIDSGSADAAAPLSEAPVEAAESTAALDGPAGNCEARLAETEDRFAVTLATLGSVQAASLPARCEAYRNHLSTLRAAEETYGACLSGFQRDETVRQFDLAAADWSGVIADLCTAP